VAGDIPQRRVPQGPALEAPGSSDPVAAENHLRLASQVISTNYFKHL